MDDIIVAQNICNNIGPVNSTNGQKIYPSIQQNTLSNHGDNVFGGIASALDDLDLSDDCD